MSDAGMVYDDGRVLLDRHAITLRRYHFPSGTAKVVPLRDIRAYRAKPMGLAPTRFQLWGTPDLCRWLPLDIRRPWKSTVITLDIPGSRPAFTPADPDAFVILLETLLGELARE